MASQDIRHWNHDFFCEFLDLYRGFPCLWQIKSKDYSDKNKKVQAYDVLIKKCMEVDPQANKDFVTKKINSFRTVYRKECAKIKASMRSGASTDEVHKPSLWYFDLLSFLSDADQEPRKSFSNLEDFYNEVQDDDLTQLDDVQGGAAALSAPPTPQDVTTDSATSTSFTSSTCRPGWKRKKKQSPTREILDLAGEKLKAMNNEYEFQVFGKYVAHKLRAFKGNQQIFAKKLINDVIYEGELESLTKGFKVMNCAASVTGNQFARPPNYNYNEYDIPHFGMLGFQQPCPPQAKSVQPIHVTESNKNNSESQSVVSTYFSNFTMN